MAVGKREEGDLARRTVGSPMELAIEDEPHPDSRADGDEGERRDFAAVAVVALGDRGSVDVVLDRRRVAEQSLEVAQHGRPFPPRQVRGHPQCQPTRLHDAGTTHDGLAERPAADRDAGVTQEVVGELPELTHPSHGTRVAGGPARTGPDGAREVGDGAADELPADVEPEHEARAAADLVEKGGATSAARPAAGVLDEPVAFQVRESERHGRLREAGSAGELATRHRTVAAHPLEQ